MRIKGELRNYICIFFATFYVICGNCFDVVVADSLFAYDANGRGEGIYAYLCNNPQKDLLVESEIRNVSSGEVSFQNRIRTAKGRLFHCYIIVAFAALLYITYASRRLVRVPDVLLISVMRNIICYIHKQDGKKDAPIFF